MDILLLGGTGHIGSRVRTEALDRGHRVTAVARDTADLDSTDGLRVEAADASEKDAIRPLAEGHDAIVASLSPRGKGGEETYLSAIETVLEVTRETDVDRVVIVGGAGSLKVDEDTELLDTPDFPEEYRDEAEAGRKARNLARDSDANWTVLCPPIVIEPGERTGSYRVGDDYLLTDDDGESYISTEDFAVALVDELEEAAHQREQFTVAY
jgi:putative NADH-flavin reductase